MGSSVPVTLHPRLRPAGSSDGVGTKGTERDAQFQRITARIVGSASPLNALRRAPLAAGRMSSKASFQDRRSGAHTAHADAAPRGHPFRHGSFSMVL